MEWTVALEDGRNILIEDGIHIFKGRNVIFKVQSWNNKLIKISINST